MNGVGTSVVLGLSKDSFGSALVSNIGSLGLDYGIPALMPASNLEFRTSDWICER